MTDPTPPSDPYATTYPSPPASPPPGSYQYPPPVGGSPYGYPGGYAPVRAQANGLGVAALVVGILAIVLSFTIVGGVVLGVLGIVFGAIGRNRAKRGEAANGGQATAGVITGAVGIVLAIALVVVFVAVGHDRVSRYNACVGTEQQTGQPLDCARFLNR